MRLVAQLDLASLCNAYLYHLLPHNLVVVKKIVWKGVSSAHNLYVWECVVYNSSTRFLELAHLCLSTTNESRFDQWLLSNHTTEQITDLWNQQRERRRRSEIVS